MNKKLKLVLIDDDPNFILYAEAMIKSVPGLRLKKAVTDPIAGLAYVLKKRVDILLLDIDMPQLSGFQLMKQIKHLIKPADPSVSPLFVILCSGYETNPYDCYKHQATHFIQKPLSLESLIEIHNVVREELTKKPVVRNDNPANKAPGQAEENAETQETFPEADVVTFQEAEGILGVKRWKVYDMRIKGQLREVINDGQKRLLRSEVMAKRDSYSVRKGKV